MLRHVDNASDAGKNHREAGETVYTSVISVLQCYLLVSRLPLSVTGISDSPAMSFTNNLCHVVWMGSPFSLVTAN